MQDDLLEILYGVLLGKSANDKSEFMLFYVIEVQIFNLKRWMYVNGWDIYHEEQPCMRNGLSGYEITFYKRKCEECK